MSYKKYIFERIAVFIFIFLVPNSFADAFFDKETSEFLQEINAYRAEKGSGALSLDAKLQNAANWMSSDMLENCASSGNPCSHNDSTGRSFSLRMRDFGYAAAAGENLAWGSGLSDSLRALDIWKNSSGHNANMLNGSYKAIGISRSCEGNVCVWATDFGSKIIQNFEMPVTQEPSPPLVPESTAGSLPKVSSASEAQDISEGALVRAKGDIDVYVIKYSGSKKFKRLILSPSVFENYGHLRWSDIIDVDRTTLNYFITSDLVRSTGDAKVYKLYPSGDTGEKRWVATSDVFIRLGFNWDAVYEINRFDRDSYKEGLSLE